jgi:elongation factor P
MVQSSQVTPGMVLSIDGELLRVDSNVKVTLPKGTPFMKARLVHLRTNEVTEKNFKLNQELEEVQLKKCSLEFLYVEGEQFLFLDIDNLDQVFVSEKIVEKQVNFLKEAVVVRATFYGDQVFHLELPQFLELMVTDTQAVESGEVMTGLNKLATLETGAQVLIPPFVDIGDVIKVDTRTYEFIQRV